MIRRLPLYCLFALSSFQVAGHEGMWIPAMLHSIEDDMQAMGLQLSAEDIYSVNNGSLKDAIVLFGGGCTAEVISDQGLILTNHHCGFGAIRSHSSVENDRLMNGFWAADRSQELTNPGLSATFIVRIEDVTASMLMGLSGTETDTERGAHLDRMAKALADSAVVGTHYKANVRPFNYGNSYFLIVSEVFTDVRLVGAPPSAIGKFGGDTDNWMWPRHTGDFSLFRIYAGEDNAPAGISTENRPFQPRHSLPIAMDGVKEGDFAMIFGFPGSTQRYLTSYEVDHIMQVQDPLRIRMRKASLAVIDAAMRSTDKRRIQYASKQNGISNGYKKYIGELRGLRELDAVERKQESERRYGEKAKALGLDKYTEALDRMGELQERSERYSVMRDLLIEFYFLGPSILQQARSMSELVDRTPALEEKGELVTVLTEQRANLGARYKDLDVEVEKAIFKALLPLYLEQVDPELRAPELAVIDRRFKGDTDAFVDDLYARSLVASEERMAKVLGKWSKGDRKRLQADPAVVFANGLYNNYVELIRPEHAAVSEEKDRTMRTYLEGMMVLYPDSVFWPDANSTLRLSYGRVEGSEPRDAVVYEAFSTLEGVLEKYVPGDVEFDVPDRLLELARNKDYGPYGENGTMPLCFTASLHTTGGNSGSPVLDGQGRLIGLNFDRTWESTMSDILFDPAKCRNIAVDVRYILFIVDKFAGAGYLVEEMELAKGDPAPHIIELPLHR